MRSRIEPMKKIARTLRAHRPLLLNYFKAKKQFSSGVIEGLNNKAKVTMRRSYGFRTFRILKLALYHSLGKLPEPELTHDFFLTNRNLTGYALDCLRRSASKRGWVRKGWKFSALCDGFCTALRDWDITRFKASERRPVIGELRSSSGAVAHRLVDFTLRIDRENRRITSGSPNNPGTISPCDLGAMDYCDDL
jgi:hypothetical protein